MGEPGQLGVEAADEELAPGTRLVELTKPDRDVTANDDRTSSGSGAMNRCSANEGVPDTQAGKAAEVTVGGTERFDSV